MRYQAQPILLHRPGCLMRGIDQLGPGARPSYGGQGERLGPASSVQQEEDRVAVEPAASLVGLV